MSIYNVKDYGAPANGVDSDSHAIQSAIDAAHSAGGGIVKIPAGNYVLKSWIVVKEGVCVEGDNWSFDPSKFKTYGTVISVETGKGNEDLSAVIMNTGTEIKDLAFVYNDQLETMPAPHVYGPTIKFYQHAGRNDYPYHKTNVKNVFFYKSYCAIDMRGSHARWNGEAANIVTCRIEDILMVSLKYGIRMNNITDWTFFDKIEQQPGYIGHHRAQGNSLRDYVVNNCVMFDCTGLLDWVKFTSCTAWACLAGVIFDNARNPVSFEGCEFDACVAPIYVKGDCSNLKVRVTNGTFTAFNPIEQEINPNNHWSSFALSLDNNATLGSFAFINSYLFGPSKGWVWLGWNTQEIDSLQIIGCNTDVSKGESVVITGTKGIRNTIITNNIFKGMNYVFSGHTDTLIEANNILK
jgi:hypothetical protein